MKRRKGGRKATNIPVTHEFLRERAERSIAGGFGKQKWVIFCEQLMQRGYALTIYEARQTVSKYITVTKNHLSFKVRFSNHKPIKARELEGDCDFFVGRTHTGIRTTDDAMRAVEQFFAEVKA